MGAHKIAHGRSCATGVRVGEATAYAGGGASRTTGHPRVGAGSLSSRRRCLAVLSSRSLRVFEAETRILPWKAFFAPRAASDRLLRPGRRICLR
jgi:hypothetical protein